MWAYILRRILAFIPTVFIAVTLIFIFTRLVPGNPVWALLGHQAVDVDRIDEVTRELGLDRPVLVQYVQWLPKALTGDFGSSIFYNRPVVQVIIDRFPVTLGLAGLAMLVTLAIGLPLGVLAAVRQNSIFDNFSMIFATLGVSLPSFWLGFLLIILFSVTLHWFPSSGYRDLSFGFSAWFSRMILPVLALSAAQIALLVRMTRSSMLEVLGQAYIVTAQAKGLKNRKVIYKHALRNAFVSIITIIGLIFALSLGGSVIIENVFAIPGLGQLITTAAIRRDYPIIEGTMVYLTVISLVINLLVDISYTIINPRLGYD
ncbi:MAG: ABC transporter permease [Trueperaceae bacterium]|nr:MAG: ABC transporter permease [Trueperaceae bacterium]